MVAQGQCEGSVARALRGELSVTLVDGEGGRHRVTARNPSDLGRQLVAAILDAGHTRWPGVALEGRDGRLESVVQRWVAAAHQGLPYALRASDLYLACACANGDPAAVAIFDRVFVTRAEQALRRSRVSPEWHADALQELRLELLVGSHGQPPGIARYDARGALVRWVEVAALRIGLRLSRPQKGHDIPVDWRWLERRPSLVDAEFQYLKLQARATFEPCLREAIALLEPRERMLLRLHFLEHLSLADLARLHGVHRATIARWLATTRTRLLRETRRVLQTRLGLTPAETESLIAFVQSQVEVRDSLLLPAT